MGRGPHRASQLVESGRQFDRDDSGPTGEPLRTARTRAIVAHAEAAPETKPPLFPHNAKFWYEIRSAFGGASYGASEFGEVLVTASRINSGDFDSWYEEWNQTAEKVAKEATDQLAQGHKVSARDGVLRAATYYRASELFLHGNP